MGFRSPVDVGTMQGMSWWLMEETVRWRSRGLAWGGEGRTIDSYWIRDWDWDWDCVWAGGGGDGGGSVVWGEGPAGAEADVMACAIACTHRRQEDAG